nr:MAG TPA: cytochrome c-552 [Caudoviricetes sp.]
MYFRRLRAECFCFSCHLVAWAAKSFFMKKISKVITILKIKLYN